MKTTTGSSASKGHRGPSKMSLEEIPEVDFSRYERVENPSAARLVEEGFSVKTGRGRPRKGKETGPTVPRSVRFPEAVWELLEARAKDEGVTLHAALRAAVMAWVTR